MVWAIRVQVLLKSQNTMSVPSTPNVRRNEAPLVPMICWYPYTKVDALNQDLTKEGNEVDRLERDLTRTQVISARVRVRAMVGRWE